MLDQLFLAGLLIQWGWFGTAIIAARLQSSNSSRVKSAGVALDNLSLIWLIALAVQYYLSYGGQYGPWYYLGATWKYFASASSAFDGWVSLKLGSVWGYLGQSKDWLTDLAGQLLGEYADELLILAPLTFMVIAPNKETRLHKIVAIYSALLAAYFFVWYVASLVPATGIVALAHIAVVVTMLILVDHGEQETRKRFYTPKTLLSRIRFRTSTEANHSEIANGLPFLTLIYLYWYVIPVPGQRAFELYLALLATAIAMLAFIGLVYALSMERIPSYQTRTNIAQEARGALFSCAVVAFGSLAGAAFLSDRGILMDLRATDLFSAVSAAWFAAVVIGAVSVTFKGAAMFIAISKAIEFGIGAAGKKSLYFDEIALPKELGCFSNGQLGFNACRLHLQEIGVSCYAFDYLTHAELLRMSGSRILMQRKHGPVAQGDAAMYRQFVQMGGSMILLVDRHDLHLKQDLLAAFGISASIIEFPENTERSLTASVRMGAQEAASTREFAVPLIDPVALHADAGSEILATANLPQPGDDGTNICNVIVATTAGRGTLLVVGALSPWQNVRFDGDLHQDCLDALIEYLDGLSPVGTGDRLAISRPTSSPAPVEAGAPAQASPLAS